MWLNTVDRRSGVDVHTERVPVSAYLGGFAYSPQE